MHLGGLPELKLFTDQDAKLCALDDIANGKIGGWAGFFTRPWILMLVTATAAVAIVVLQPSGRILNIRGRTGGYLDLVLLITFIYIIFIPMHRPFAARHLRRRLLESGVPVCLKCGYDLRGLGNMVREGLTCPECGAPVSERAVALLRRDEIPTQPQHS